MELQTAIKETLDAARAANNKEYKQTNLFIDSDIAVCFVIDHCLGKNDDIIYKQSRNYGFTRLDSIGFRLP